MRVVSADWVVPVEGEPVPDGAVAIGDDGRVVAVGPTSELGAGEAFPGGVILPGLVNCHSHLEYAVYAGFGDGLPFSSWIGLHVARKRLLDLDDMRAIAIDGAHECLRSGITTVGDCSFAGAAADAAAETVLRAIVYLEVFGRDAAAMEQFAELRDRVEPVLSDRVRLGVSPHAPYTCTLELYAACAALGLPLATHLAESLAERAFLANGSGDWTAFADMLVPPPGQTGIRMLAEAGLLGPGVTAAHCVDVEPDEIALLAANGVGVAHCPRSNGMLGCGTAPLADLCAAGIAVGIATDSPASTPSFDLFDELRTAIVAARARERRPDALTARDALELATLGGARVLGLDAEIGSLVPGKWADLVVLSLDDTPLSPVEDPVVSAVLGGAPDRVAATLVAGRDRYRRGTSAWPDSRRAARRARSRMLR
jgi:cytosine/adenosine deaminase-related metal-dependent hydrolase